MPAMDSVSTFTGAATRRVMLTDFRVRAFYPPFAASTIGVAHPLQQRDRTTDGIHFAPADA